jgi:hypothetical protein
LSSSPHPKKGSLKDIRTLKYWIFENDCNRVGETL